MLNKAQLLKEKRCRKCKFLKYASFAIACGLGASAILAGSEALGIGAVSHVIFACVAGILEIESR